MLLDMMKLYRFSGKDDYYNMVFKKDINAYHNVNVVEETYYFAKIMNLDLTDERLKLLCKKDIIPKNNSEKIVNNLKIVFKSIFQNIKNFELLPNELLDVANMIYKDVYKVKFVVEKVKDNGPFSTSTQKINQFDTLEELFKKFESLRKSKEYEISLLISNFFIDFINYKLFEETDNYKVNDYMGYLMIYILLFKFEFECFHYKPFFNCIYENMKTFHNAIQQCSFNWSSGYSNVTLVHRFIVEQLLECYDEVEGELMKQSHMRDYKFSKDEEIAIAIQNFPGDTFSKSDIQKLHPNISLKTIERTLERLQKENQIEALGTGRSAKWMKKFKIQAGFEYDVAQFNFDDIEEKK